MSKDRSRPRKAIETRAGSTKSRCKSCLFDLFDSDVDLFRDHVRGRQRRARVRAALWRLHEPADARRARSRACFRSSTRCERSARRTLPLIDDVVTAQNIYSITDVYGTGETHFGNPRDARTCESVYDVSSPCNDPNAAARLQPRRLSQHASRASTNKLGSRRFVRFTAASAGSHTITVRAVAPLNAAADPDMVLHSGGRRSRSPTDAPAARAARTRRTTVSRRSRRRSLAGRPCARGLRMDQHQRGDGRVPADRPHVLRRDGDAAVSAVRRCTGSVRCSPQRSAWRRSVVAQPRRQASPADAPVRVQARRAFVAGQAAGADLGELSCSSAAPAVGVPLDRHRHRAYADAAAGDIVARRAHGRPRERCASPPRLAAAAGSGYTRGKSRVAPLVVACGLLERHRVGRRAPRGLKRAASRAAAHRRACRRSPRCRVATATARR